MARRTGTRGITGVVALRTFGLRYRQSAEKNYELTKPVRLIVGATRLLAGVVQRNQRFDCPVYLSMNGQDKPRYLSAVG